MSDIGVVLLACLAGGVGAVLRYVLDVVVQHFVPDGYPWGVFLVNVVGSFAAGAVVGAAGPSGAVVTVVVFGLLGGFTTFSTTMVQSLRLGVGRGGTDALVHAAGTWVACVSAAALAMALVG